MPRAGVRLLPSQASGRIEGCLTLDGETQLERSIDLYAVELVVGMTFLHEAIP